MNPKKTIQQQIDAKAITERKGVGADNIGGQDKIDPPRLPLPKPGTNEQDGSPRPQLGGISYQGD